MVFEVIRPNSSFKTAVDTSKESNIQPQFKYFSSFCDFNFSAILYIALEDMGPVKMTYIIFTLKILKL